MSRHAGKAKLSASVSRLVSTDSSLRGIQSPTSVSAGEGNVDLLCVVESVEVHGVERARVDQHTLLSSVDVISSRDHNTTDIQLTSDHDPLVSIPTSDIDLNNKAIDQV